MKNNISSKEAHLNKLHKKTIKHSYFIKRLRAILPISGLIIIVLTMAWSYVPEIFKEKKFRDISDISILQKLNNQALNIKSFMQDTTGSPFKITADKFIKVENNLLKFINPKGVTITNEGKTLNIIAKTGILNKSTNTINYPGQAKYYDTDNNIIEGKNFLLDIINKTLQSNKTANIFFDGGKIIPSKGFFMDNNKKLITFYGSTEIIITHR